MRIRRLTFRNIRNHTATQLLAADGVNIITGMNGQGKTSILEAISLCTLTRSFVGTNDASLIRRGEKFLESSVEGVSDYGVSRRFDLRYDPTLGKTIRLDGTPAGNAAQVIGTAPTVVLSPDMKAISGGGPGERRRFVDMVISQAKRRYLEDLIHYRRILKQRNAVLAAALKHRRPVDRNLIETYDEGLIERAAHLMMERTRFIEEFKPLLRQTASDVAGGADEVTIRYQPDCSRTPCASVADYRDLLWLRSQQVAAEEQRRGTTLFGVHRDDIRMEINGGDVRVSASQGQHKTLLIGLKVAEFHYLANQCAETPIILLDDIFGELDARRAERVYDLTRNLAQVFLTVVSFDLLPFLRGRTLGESEANIEVVGGNIEAKVGDSIMDIAAQHATQ
ncbi:MAG: DNA replication and repair protein RecF [Chlorobi bacterium]|nr:MAG: DNA replication and repair protein RecF [Chlorobi bacterium OLB7]MBK8911844.1 DNA replication and repair protein RecF [Chlorobiota bacterium]MBX7215514.1 DNA replication and repair protein RecF [Candidatus Kapabacteria bacterium]